MCVVRAWMNATPAKRKEVALYTLHMLHGCQCQTISPNWTSNGCEKCLAHSCSATLIKRNVAGRNRRRADNCARGDKRWHCTNFYRNNRSIVMSIHSLIQSPTTTVADRIRRLAASDSHTLILSHSPGQSATGDRATIARVQEYNKNEIFQQHSSSSPEANWINIITQQQQKQAQNRRVSHFPPYTTHTIFRFFFCCCSFYSIILIVLHGLSGQVLRQSTKKKNVRQEISKCIQKERRTKI